MFDTCKALTTLDLTKTSVEKIGSYSFMYTPVSLTIPSTVHTIETYAFTKNTGIFTFQNVNNLTTVGNYAFAYVTNLTAQDKAAILALNSTATDNKTPNLGLASYGERKVYTEQTFMLDT